MPNITVKSTEPHRNRTQTTLFIPYHCSAGVGRSGTVIAINYCLHRLKEEGVIDVCDFVKRMRRQRNYMVQTEQQYTFIHYAILESIAYGDTSSPLTDFTSLYENLQAVNPESKKTRIDEEYSRLGQVKTMVKKSAFQKRLKRKGEPPRHFESSCELHCHAKFCSTSFTVATSP